MKGWDFISPNQLVKGKDLTSLHEFGNVEGFAEALNSDLVNRIAGDEEDDICGPRSTSSFSIKAVEHQRIFHFFLNDSNKYIIFLLFLCAVLSIGFGIKEEDLDSGVGVRKEEEERISLVVFFF